MKRFRISIGSASCKSIPSRDSYALEACSVVNEKIVYLKSLKSEQLAKWNDLEAVEINLSGRHGVMTIYNDRIDAKKNLLVVQLFYPTWRYPNYFSLERVGRIVAEGFFIDDENNISDALDNDLWEYR